MGASERPPVLVFGHSVTVLGVLRILGRGGIPASVATPDNSFISKSKWYRPVTEASDDGPSPTELASFLEGLPFERAVLLPCADDWVRAVSSLEASLRRRFPACVSEPSTIDTLMDKGRLAKELDRLAVPHPRTTPIRSAQDLETLPDEFFKDAFLKPRDSLAFLRVYGRKGFRLHDKADAVARFREIDEHDLRMVLQEFIPAPASDHYFVEGFVDGRGNVCARFAHRRLRNFPPDWGRSTYLVSIPLDEVAPAVRSLDRVLSTLHYRGVFNAEFVHDRRTDSFLLLEVNVRPWEHVEFTARCGIDVCRMAYRDALGLPVEPVVSYALGRHSVDLFNDYASVMPLIRGGRLNPFAWILSIVSAEGFVFSWDDPWPAIWRAPEFPLHRQPLPFRMRRRPT